MEQIQFGDKTLQAYLAKPESGSGPGVIVLHAWWGLTGCITELCDRLAGEGFLALAPDLYHGATSKTIEEAKALRAGLDRTIARQEIAHWIDTLRRHPATHPAPLGAVGLSLGANLAAQMAEEKPDDLAAVVLFYGLRAGQFHHARAAFLGHFAEEDPFVAIEAVEKFTENLKATGREVETFIYPGAQHWFFENDQPECYQEIASKLAWDRTVEFLREKLA